MVLESFEHMLEDTIQACIINYTTIQCSSCLLLIALEWSTQVQPKMTGDWNFNCYIVAALFCCINPSIVFGGEGIEIVDV